MPDPFHRISPYYTQLTEKHGCNTRACDYGHPESQLVKFQVLSQVCNLAGQRILDVGCGFADYAEFLRKKYGVLNYVGLDITPLMIERSQKLYPQLDLRLGNFLDVPLDETFDVVTANGIFYLLDEPKEDTLRAIVTKMFDLARVAVAFNSLSSWALNKEAGEFYADPIETVNFCRTLTPWVALRHDYHPRDFTIFMYRDAQS